ncbi:hypothetical protein DL769_005184 [Monosporascus sp. CRB-8-3]|nr:hypothetical protein DL769_005184 [Monosporascus sp. CRB-8-3]
MSSYNPASEGYALRVIDDASEMRGVVRSYEGADAMVYCLARVRALMEKSHLIYGLAFAWKAILDVCPYATYEWDGTGDVTFQEAEDGEENCDGFHKRVDELLLAICHMQRGSRNTAWLAGDRVKDIRQLQENSGPPCRFQYPQSLKFL